MTVAADGMARELGAALHEVHDQAAHVEKALHARPLLGRGLLADQEREEAIARLRGCLDDVRRAKALLLVLVARRAPPVQPKLVRCAARDRDCGNLATVGKKTGAPRCQTCYVRERRQRLRQAG